MVGNPTVVKLTQNFPLKKWTYVTISVDNSYIDSDIDGKLIRSIKLEGFAYYSCKLCLYQQKCNSYPSCAINCTIF